MAAAYADWDSLWGSAGQLGLNIAALLLAGVLTLGIQRAIYVRRAAARAERQARYRRGSPVVR